MRQKKSLVVPSANAMGKDWAISGRASLWFYECFGPCKVIMTATGERQVLDIMWNEMKRAYDQRPLQDSMGSMVTGKLSAGPDWFITAFTTKESKDQPGKFQGIHSDRLMIIVSEAQGVDDIIFEQIDGLTMAGIVLPVYLGNPLTNVGRFAKMIEDTEKNMVVRLDAYDCINVKEKRQVLPGLVSWEWVKDKEERWNQDKSGKDPRYMARVRGLLPTSSINTVISKDLYDRCVNKQLSWWSGKYGTIGVDPALTGVDDMVITVMESGKEIDSLVMPYCEAPEACAKIAAMQSKWFPTGGCVVVIDSDGLGLPIAQFYRQMIPNTFNPISLVEFHGSCSDRELVGQQFANHRAEAAFYAKQRMMDGHISLVDDPTTRDEATTEMYFTNPRNGKDQLEDKEDIRTRLGRSPDRWDSKKLAIWGFKTASKIKVKDKWSTDSEGYGSIGRPRIRSAMSV
jgi:hypothetical protein